MNGQEAGHQAPAQQGTLTRRVEATPTAQPRSSGDGQRQAETAVAPSRAQPEPSSAHGPVHSTPGEDRATPFARVSLFANLDAESLRELSAVTRRRSFRAGDVIFHRDDPGQVLYVIQAGKVRIYISSQDGQEVTLAVMGPGDYFGELALLDEHPRSASAIALDPVEVLALQRSDFLNAVARHPRIAIQVMRVLSLRLRQTDTMIEDLLFLDVHGRVAKKLLELAELHGVRTPEGIRIEMKLTQTDLAALVGASRESVNKVIGYFIDKCFISAEKRKITILRLADLRRRIC